MGSAVFTDADVAAALDMDAAIASQRRAFTALGRGEAQLADKVALPNPEGSDVALSYLSRLSPRHGVVQKLVAVHPDNAARHLPAISATMLVLDPVTGQLVATLEAAKLTEMRTAAGSAVAADVLAPPDADTLAIVGSGVQARAHVRAISRVRKLRDVRLYSRDRGRGEAVADELSRELELRVRAVDSTAEAVRDAAVIATCTLSAEPVVRTGDLSAGATVISVGSFEPHRAEVDDRLVPSAASVVVDDVATAAEHAGPIITALRDGHITRERLRGLGAVLAGLTSGRDGDGDLVFYNSVGIGVQDAAAAHAVLGTL